VIVSQTGDERWVFLGDSLTEGVGNRRVSWVSQLALILRAGKMRPVHGVRLRMLDLSTRRDLSYFNLVGHVDLDECQIGSSLWLINLAAESTTIRNDVERSSLIAAMKPHRIFILRGPLETIVRPSEATAGRWPFWVPPSWRGYAAMDPRCYFSAAIWRRGKQLAVDRAKQHVRLALLQKGGEPLLSDEEFLTAYDELLTSLVGTGSAITVLALPPISVVSFPGTMERIVVRNRKLADLAAHKRVDFLEWPCELQAGWGSQFCRDGFHPTETGAEVMAKRVHQYLMGSSAPVGAEADA
jgi:hypothetical protein